MITKLEPGMQVRYNGNVHPSQIRWGANDDPQGILIINETYTVADVQEHSTYTRVFLKEHPTKPFNVVWFDPIETWQVFLSEVKLDCEHLKIDQKTALAVWRTGLSILAKSI